MSREGAGGRVTRGAAKAGRDLEHMSQRTVPANTAHPTTWKGAGPNSVFALGGGTAPSQRPATTEQVATTTIAGIQIRSGIPKPPQGPGFTKYGAVLERMAVGDSVELATKVAKAFYAAAKKYAKASAPVRSYSYRTTSDTTGAIWRDA